MGCVAGGNGKDANAIADGATPDLNLCPTYYLNSGACPQRGLYCRYFEAACYCDA